MSNVTINIVELSSNLAEQCTKEELISSNLPYFDDNDFVQPSEDDPNMLVWKPEVQEVYDRWYDYYYDEISKCKQEDKIIVSVLGGVATCDDKRVDIIDHDNEGNHYHCNTCGEVWKGWMNRCPNCHQSNFMYISEELYEKQLNTKTDERVKGL